ncbi:MAG: NAD(P)/FAD-dependent oxidoreductase [Cellulosilyticaceae bacterium]
MHYVVLGASAAGLSGVKRLRELDANAQITLISKDEHIYSRCILHHYMEGIRDLAKLSFIAPTFLQNYRIEWLSGETVTQVDPHSKTITTNHQKTLGFDKLLIATGSHVFFPPIPGLREATNAIGFHDLDECVDIMAKAKTAEHIVVLGAGLVGIDAICGLLHLGKSLTLVEMKTHMLALQLDKRSAATYEEAFRAKGVQQFYGVKAQELVLDTSHRIQQVVLDTGEHLPCDLLIVASGVRSNVDFLEGSGIETDRFGLVIDVFGKTSHPDIYGAGDVTGRNPIWPIAVKEGIIAACNMVGESKQMTDFFASKATMNFLGVPTLSLGLHTPENPEEYEIELEEDADGNYKKIVHKEGKIYGALLQGDLSYSGILTQLIKNNIDVSQVKKPLFTIDYSDFFHLTEDLEYIYSH